MMALASPNVNFYCILVMLLDHHFWCCASYFVLVHVDQNGAFVRWPRLCSLGVHFFVSILKQKYSTRDHPINAPDLKKISKSWTVLN